METTFVKEGNKEQINRYLYGKDTRKTYMQLFDSSDATGIQGLRNEIAPNNEKILRILGKNSQLLTGYTDSQFENLEKALYEKHIDSQTIVIFDGDSLEENAPFTQFIKFLKFLKKEGITIYAIKFFEEQDYNKNKGYKKSFVDPWKDEGIGLVLSNTEASKVGEKLNDHILNIGSFDDRVAYSKQMVKSVLKEDEINKLDLSEFKSTELDKLTQDQWSKIYSKLESQSKIDSASGSHTGDTRTFKNPDIKYPKTMDETMDETMGETMSGKNTLLESILVIPSGIQDTIKGLNDHNIDKIYTTENLSRLINKPEGKEWDISDLAGKNYLFFNTNVNTNTGLSNEGGKRSKKNRKNRKTKKARKSKKLKKTKSRKMRKSKRRHR